MATYDELSTLGDNDALRNRVGQAAGIVGMDVNEDAANQPTPTADVELQKQRRELASQIISRGPQGAGAFFFWAVIWQNEAATLNQIENAPDNAIKSNVQQVYDLIATSSFVTNQTTPVV